MLSVALFNIKYGGRHKVADKLLISNLLVRMLYIFSRYATYADVLEKCLIFCSEERIIDFNLGQLLENFIQHKS